MISSEYGLSLDHIGSIRCCLGRGIDISYGIGANVYGR